MNLLCEFAHSFPWLAAEILHRDTHKRRNFREESITDVLMAGLTAFEPFGVRVDFPEDESKTGEDMDWEFVQPNATDGRRYLRLHIQAKRAIRSKGSAPYWFYRELDHAVPKKGAKGTQHSLLLNGASAIPGCVPMYIFYHSRDALSHGHSGAKPIEGVNLIFADFIPSKVTTKAWPVADKKVERWRPHFLSLSDILCFAGGPSVPPSDPDTFLRWLLFGFGGEALVSPGPLADRLNERRTEGADVRLVETSEEIPDDTMQALERRERFKRLPDLQRPRAIFGPWSL